MGGSGPCFGLKGKSVIHQPQFPLQWCALCHFIIIYLYIWNTSQFFKLQHLKKKKKKKTQPSHLKLTVFPKVFPQHTDTCTHHNINTGCNQVIYLQFWCFSVFGNWRLSSIFPPTFHCLECLVMLFLKVQFIQHIYLYVIGKFSWHSCWNMAVFLTVSILKWF